jgi:putative transposase
MSTRTEAPRPFFTSQNTTAAYELRYHFCWQTHSRQPWFEDPALVEVAEAALADVAERYEIHLLKSSFKPTCLRTLLSLRPGMSPSSIARLVKGNIISRVRPMTAGRRLWSRGWFVRSNGHVTNETVRNYVKQQFAHHRAEPISSVDTSLAKFHGDTDLSVLRHASHVTFEYNAHIVFITQHRLDFLDLYVADELMRYLRCVCARKQWIVHDIEIVWDHVHLFLGLNPADAAGDVALSLMNNSAYMLHKRYDGAIRSDGIPGVWSPGYYAGTVGAASTAQIKTFLDDEY